MLNLSEMVQMCRVPSDKKIRIKDLHTTWESAPTAAESKRRHEAKKLLQEDVQHLVEAQELLYAADSWSVLVILQAMDAAGKDSTIAHVMSGVNPQGVEVFAFKRPSQEELDHDFLWRCNKALPERGRIGIFNRSYYAEVLVVKLHPQLRRNQLVA